MSLEQTTRNPDLLKDALRTIAYQRESEFLVIKAEDINAEIEPLPSVNQPVGLNNIGNTCYLNSLLQFYYTINSIRDVVIGFETHRMDLDSASAIADIEKKKVGGRKITKNEILKAQKCKYLYDVLGL
jgi:ubiquitin carboxyl-terminal hydrolase 25/28